MKTVQPERFSRGDIKTVKPERFSRRHKIRHRRKVSVGEIYDGSHEENCLKQYQLAAAAAGFPPAPTLRKNNLCLD